MPIAIILFSCFTKALIEEKVEEERAFQEKIAQRSPDKQHQRHSKDTSQQASSPLKVVIGPSQHGMTLLCHLSVSEVNSLGNLREAYIISAFQILCIYFAV